MKGRFLLDVIVGKGAPVFELLPDEDQPLLVWWEWRWGFKLFKFGDFSDWVIWVSGCEPLRVNLSHQNFLVHLFISLKIN